MLKPQDIVILLKILSKLKLPKNERPGLLSQNKLAHDLCMSASEVNAGIKRLVLSGLLSPVINEDPKNKIVFKPNKKACEECLISGIKYFFSSTARGLYSRYCNELCCASIGRASHLR